MSWPREIERIALFMLLAAVACQFASPAALAENDAPGGKQSIADGRLIAKKNGSIKWHKNFNEALKLAKESRKWVLVDVYTDWCHWCHKLDEDVYTNAKVIEFLNKSFVCVKANAEKGDGVGVAKRYSVQGFPCTLVLDPSGNEKGRLPGYADATSYPKAIAGIIKGQ